MFRINFDQCARDLVRGAVIRHSKMIALGTLATAGVFTYYKGAEWANLSFDCIFLKHPRVDS